MAHGRARAMADRHTAQGFTVLEVIVSFIIVALTLAAAMQAFSGGFRNAVTSAKYTTALAHAENDLARFGADLALARGTRTGRYADGMAWRHVVTPLDPPAAGGSPAAYQVEVSVFPDGPGPNARTVTLTGVHLDQGGAY